jgi:hypothetical protein
MTSDAWPSSDAAPGPLPRIDDLPVVGQGYDQEAVERAFDSFYRHAAQLDASLRALEAVEVFRRDADALRNDLRALRSLGVGGGLPEPAWAKTSERFEVQRFEVPSVVLRLAAEAALIVAVAVICAVAHLRPVVVVALMAATFVVVALAEWLAGRGRFVPPPLAFLPLPVDGEPAPYVEAPGPSRGGPGEPDEETEPESLTIVASVDEVEAASSAVVDPWEQGPHPEDAEPEDADPEDAEPQAEAELAERSGLFRRRRR